MKASIVDLRYKTKQVMQAIDRRETVEIYYRGKQKAVLIPLAKESSKTIKRNLENHPFCSMDKSALSVEEVMSDLRKGRHHAL